jgi:hypothetical protein
MPLAGISVSDLLAVTLALVAAGAVMGVSGTGLMLLTRGASPGQIAGVLVPMATVSLVALLVLWALYRNVDRGGSASLAAQSRSPGEWVLRPGANGHARADESSRIRNAIASASAAGGGRVMLRGGTFTIRRTIELESDVLVEIAAGAILRWTGAPRGTLFASDPDAPLQRAGVEGRRARIEANQGLERVFDLHSPQFTTLAGLEIVGGTPSMTVVRIRADARRRTGYEETRNAVFNEVRDLLVSGPCAVALELWGRGPDGVVTLNHVEDVSASDVRRTGARLVQWVDSNVFSGAMRFSLGGSGATGVVFNDSPDPSADVGVYNNEFAALAVDTFGGRFTGRRGVVLNKSKATRILAFQQDPQAEGGSLVDRYGDSYSIVQTGAAGRSDVTVHQKGVQESTAMAGGR